MELTLPSRPSMSCGFFQEWEGDEEETVHTFVY